MADQRRPTTRAPGSVEQGISDTASMASKGAGAGAALIDSSRKSPPWKSTLSLRRAGKVFGPLGTGLDLVDGVAGYEADVARGVAPKQAAVANGGRVGAGMAGATAGGMIAGLPGAFVGGLLGELGWNRTSMTIEELRRLAREAAVYNTPRYWLNRRGPPSNLR